ncbi:MAG TPA: histidine kinase [Longimicrobium sp.]|nr:histidine kinase [Longimicrobium sp.]
MPPDHPVPPSHARPALSRWAVAAALGAWLGVNLLMLAPDFRGAVLPGGRPATPALALLLALPSSLVLTAAAWAAFRLTRRYTVARGGGIRSAGVHLAAALGFALLNTGVRKGERLLLADPGPGFPSSRDAGELAAVVVVYGVLALVAHALEHALRYQERQLAELRLQASLARAELDRTDAELRVLKLQLNPHFLFNSLHAVSALVHDAPSAAERMVLRLRDLLQSAAGRVGTQEVTLEEEVRTLEPFVEVEQIRLDGRLRVEWRIDDDARGACVPHMVLQPLVENAIKHGLAARPEGGRVEIAARRDDGWLELAVRDDGIGLDAAAGRGAAGAGIGTANTRARLGQLYGDDFGMEMRPAKGGGTEVSLRIPWHQAPLPGPALTGTAAEAEKPARGVRRWLGPAAAAVIFLVLARRGVAGLHNREMFPDRVAGHAEAVVCGILGAAVLTLLCCAAFVLARREPVVSGAAGRALRRHARAGLLLALLATFERNACAVAWGTPLATLATPAQLAALAAQVVFWMSVFALLALLAHALEYARRTRMKEAAALRLQASLARAELEHASAELRGLRMQVNPGFLFSALEAVAARVHQSPAEAERMVVRLADLLRQAMQSACVHEVPLEEELRALEPFLEVERIRRGGRLRVERRVDDEALDAFVPHLLLQPLVMDAVGQDAPVNGDAACVAIGARRREEWLELEVRGPAAAAASDAAAETRARLAGTYGGRCTVEPMGVEGGGTRIVVHLPWREEPWSAPAPDTKEEAMA